MRCLTPPRMIISFQSTRPVRGETGAGSEVTHDRKYFNPLAPCGARLRRVVCVGYGPGISIHSPRAGRDGVAQIFHAAAQKFQSTRPVRGETAASGCLSLRYPDFNPLAPCGARRQVIRLGCRTMKFQSTRPVRGETTEVYLNAICYVFQSTRPVRGETTRMGARRLQAQYFNPLAPCGARQEIKHFPLIHCAYFNPLAPCGARRN